MKNGKKIKIIILLSLLGLILSLWLIFKVDKGDDLVEPTCAVERGPLTISVINSGTVHSRDKIIIACQLEGRSILTWMIEEGTNVQTGDLLVEFDSDEIEEDFQQQEIKTVNALTDLEIAREKIGITEGDCEAAMLDCEVGLELAELELDKYEKGDYPQQVSQNIADIALADEEVKRSAEKLEWSQRLAKEGYLTRTELQADELALKRKEIDLKMAATRMNVLTNYTVMMQRAKLKSDLRKADRKLERIKWQNSSSVRTAASQLFARSREYQRSSNRLEKLKFEIDKAKIYAPTNGFVLYATTVKMRRRWWTRPLAIGSSVAKREELIYMPLESGMIVEVMIPEASLNKIFEGMPVKINIDAFPARTFAGKLTKIGILPDAQSAQLNPGLKLYKCEVECDFKEVTVRPGMSCDVELIKDVYHHELYVPVQCVVRVDDKPRVYVKKGAQWIPRDIEVGLDNNTMIHILSGVDEGEIVMLAPPVSESIKAADDELPKAMLDGEDGRQGEQEQSGVRKARKVQESDGLINGGEHHDSVRNRAPVATRARSAKKKGAAGRATKGRQPVGKQR